MQGGSKARVTRNTWVAVNDTACRCMGARRNFRRGASPKNAPPPSHMEKKPSGEKVAKGPHKEKNVTNSTPYREFCLIFLGGRTPTLAPPPQCGRQWADMCKALD